jgi:hypothetical protein
LKSTIDHQPVGQKPAAAAAPAASFKLCVSWAKFPPLYLMFLRSVRAVFPSRLAQMCALPVVAVKLAGSSRPRPLAPCHQAVGAFCECRDPLYKRVAAIAPYRNTWQHVLRCEVGSKGLRRWLCGEGWVWVTG